MVVWEMVGVCVWVVWWCVGWWCGCVGGVGGWCWGGAPPQPSPHWTQQKQQQRRACVLLCCCSSAARAGARRVRVRGACAVCVRARPRACAVRANPGLLPARLPWHSGGGKCLAGGGARELEPAGVTDRHWHTVTPWHRRESEPMHGEHDGINDSRRGVVAALCCGVFCLLLGYDDALVETLHFDFPLLSDIVRSHSLLAAVPIILDNSS